MRTVPAGEFKQHCLALLDEVGVSGEAILITKRGRPVARLGPVSPDDREDWSGAMADRGRIIGDLVAPATDPEDWEALRG